MISLYKFADLPRNVLYSFGPFLTKESPCTRMQDMQPCIEKHENHSIHGLLSSDDNSLLETKLFLQTIEELLCRSSIVIWL